jgi:hypothetical protein
MILFKQHYMEYEHHIKNKNLREVVPLVALFVPLRTLGVSWMKLQISIATNIDRPAL